MRRRPTDFGARADSGDQEIKMQNWVSGVTEQRGFGRAISLNPTLRHFLYKTSSDALMRHYFGNKFGRIHSILDLIVLSLARDLHFKSLTWKRDLGALTFRFPPQIVFICHLGTAVAADIALLADTRWNCVSLGLN